MYVYMYDLPDSGETDARFNIHTHMQTYIQAEHQDACSTRNAEYPSHTHTCIHTYIHTYIQAEQLASKMLVVQEMHDISVTELTQSLQVANATVKTLNATIRNMSSEQMRNRSVWNMRERIDREHERLARECLLRTRRCVCMYVYTKYA
jgi:hypothetical protein